MSERCDDGSQLLLDDWIAERPQALSLTFEDPLARLVLEGEHAKQLGGVFEILRKELNSRPAKGIRTAAALYASTGTSIAIASTRGTQKPSCSAQRDIHAQSPVIGSQLGVWTGPVKINRSGSILYSSITARIAA
jgi:hypothetical protein